MRLLPGTLIIFSVALSQGQDDASRQAAMNRLRDVLSNHGQVNWVQTPAASDVPPQSTHVTATLTDVAVDVGTCKLSFKDGRVFPDQRYQSVQNRTLRLPQIDRIKVDSLEGFMEGFRAEGGLPRWGTKTSPAIFVLEMFAAPDQKFQVHRWSRNGENKALERDLNDSMAFVVFAEEAAALEAAKALQRAKELCAK
jgi:hypothetical protein